MCFSEWEPGNAIQRISVRENMMRSTRRRDLAVRQSHHRRLESDGGGKWIQTVYEKVSCFLEWISGKNRIPLGSLAWDGPERPVRDFWIRAK